MSAPLPGLPQPERELFERTADRFSECVRRTFGLNMLALANAEGIDLGENATPILIPMLAGLFSAAGIICSEFEAAGLDVDKLRDHVLPQFDAGRADGHALQRANSGSAVQ